MFHAAHHRTPLHGAAISGLLLLLAALPIAAQETGGSATFRLDPSRSGVVDDGVELRDDYPADLAPLWTSDGPGTAKGMGAGSPAVADGKVFVYATDPESTEAYEQVHCLDAATGERLWLQTFPGKKSAYGNHCTPAVADGRVYVGGQKGQLWCLDAASGEVVWQRDGGGPVASSPLLVSGLVICGHRDIHAFDAASGEPRWEAEGATETHSPVAWFHDGKAYIIATLSRKKQDSQLQCIDAESGTVVWTAAVPDSLKHTTPAIDGDLLAVAGEKHLSVLRLGPDGATLIGQTKDKGGRGSAPIVHGQSIIAGNCVRYAVVDGELQKSWESKIDIRDGSSSPILANGKIFGIAELDKKEYDKKARIYSYPISYTRVVVVDAASGELLGRFGEKLGVIMVSPVIADGRLYVRGPEGVSCWDLTAP